LEKEYHENPKKSSEKIFIFKQMRAIFLFLMVLVMNNHTSAQDYGTFKDSRDGKTYATLDIGNQTWMAENLAYEGASYKVYNNNPANLRNYGGLYTWPNALKACPAGWHLPTDNEWLELIDFLGGKDLAGQKLKEIGFATLHGGNFNSGLNIFLLGGDASFWWSKTPDDFQFGLFKNHLSISNYDKHCEFKPISKEMFYSVRCVKD